MKFFQGVSLALALGTCGSVLAQSLGEVVVTASRGARDAAQALADVTVYDREAIDRLGASSVPELLRRMGGIEVAQTGALGATSGVFLRGTRTAQTLVLVDGLRVENAGAGGAQLEYLPLPLIERIEILRGPGSALYGSAAIGGVIQIFTRGSEGPTGPSASLALGSQGSSQLTAAHVAQSAATRWSLALSDEGTRGFEATRAASPYHEADRDGGRQQSLLASLRQTLSGAWEWGGTLRASVGHNRWDNASVNPEGSQWQHSTQAAGVWLRGRVSDLWSTEWRVGQTGVRYQPTSESYVANQRALTQSVLWQNDLRHETGRYTFAVEQIRQTARGDERYFDSPSQLDVSRRTDSVFAAWERGFGAHLWRAQIRQDHIEGFGSQPNGALAWGLALDRHWMLRSSVATAFRAPTFTDLYYPGYANPSLRPERSRGVEAALEYREGSSLAKLTAFANRVRDAIEYGDLPSNVPQARVEGATLEFRHPLGPWRFSGSLTAQDPRGSQFTFPAPDYVAVPWNGLLPRRARQHGVLEARRDLGPLDLGLSVFGQGRRVDSAGGANAMAGYLVLDLDARWRIDRAVEGFVRLGNLADHRYETAWGYHMPPRTLFGGVRYRPQ